MRTTPGEAAHPAGRAARSKEASVAGTHGTEVFGSFRIRAIGGGPLRGARLFRSCELADIDADEASFLVNELHIASIYDIRNQWEVAANREPVSYTHLDVYKRQGSTRRHGSWRCRCGAGRCR